MRVGEVSTVKGFSVYLYITSELLEYPLKETENAFSVPCRSAFPFMLQCVILCDGPVRLEFRP